MEKFEKVEVQIINAFVDNDKGGNPAGVVLNADSLSNDQKLAIAGRVGLSETAFVSKSNTADFKLDFFTPTRQIAHCGHATIATFSYLSQLGEITTARSSKETIDGRREILIRDGMAFMEQKAPQQLNINNERDAILESLGLNENDLLAKAPISVINTGNAFVIIPVAGSDIMKRIKPDFDLIAQVSEAHDLIGYYVFCLQTNMAGRDANTRMFAPRYGIKEEAGTGMAAGPLACYLYDTLNLKKNQLLVEQGWFMEHPSPSLITVDLLLDNNMITNVMAGGRGMHLRTITMSI